MGLDNLCEQFLQMVLCIGSLGKLEKQGLESQCEIQTVHKVFHTTLPVHTLHQTCSSSSGLCVIPHCSGIIFLLAIHPGKHTLSLLWGSPIPHLSGPYLLALCKSPLTVHFPVSMGLFHLLNFDSLGWGWKLLMSLIMVSTLIPDS